MDNEAVELQEEETTGAEEEVEAPEEGEEAAGESEIVLDDEGGSQPQKATGNFGVRKRINKLNKRNHETNATLEVEKEKSRLLQIALDQERENSTRAEQNSPSSVPNPADFADGVYDEGYKKAYEEYADRRADQRFDKKFAEKTKHSAQSANKDLRRGNLEKKQLTHYQNAAELGVSDFDEAEDALIEILGEENINHIIENFDKSHVINYYLGKNPDKAEEIAALLNTNAIKAVAELGRLETRLKIKSKSNLPSHPDEELEGGGPSTTAHLASKHKKLLKKACAGKQADMTKLSEFRKKMKAKGIKF